MKLSEIQIDGGTQCRDELDDSVVAEYAEAIRAGDDFPPATVFFDGSKHWLADGFHRYHAYKRAGAIEIPADIRNGTRRDAILYSSGANKQHGLRRSVAAKRNAVTNLLRDDEWSLWSDREIARHCGVSHPFVASLRAPKSQKPLETLPLAEETKGKPLETLPLAEETKGKPLETLPLAEEMVSTQVAPKSSAAALQDRENKAAPAENKEVDYKAECEKLSNALDIAQNDINELTADNNAMGAVFDSDDKLAEATKKIAQLLAENRVLQERVNGLMNEKNRALQELKRALNKIKKLEAVSDAGY
jgi:ParB-like chromosome segregation protein Spo0J